jgi:hypothetical protein
MKVAIIHASMMGEKKKFSVDSPKKGKILESRKISNFFILRFVRKTPRKHTAMAIKATATPMLANRMVKMTPGKSASSAASALAAAVAAAGAVAPAPAALMLPLPVVVALPVAGAEAADAVAAAGSRPPPPEESTAVSDDSQLGVAAVDMINLPFFFA